MPSSPLVLVQDGAGPFLGATGGVNVTNGNTISIKLQTPAGVSAWYLEIFGVDEVTATAPSLAGVNPTTHLVSTPTTVVTFTMPAGVGVGRAIVLRSWVDGGGPGLVTTFGIYALTAALARVGAVNEKFEGDPNFGWVTKLNPIIRAGGVPTIPTGPATGDLSGVYPNPTVIKINGTTVPATFGGDVLKVLTCTGAGVASWQPQLAFSAGGDLTGTPSNQKVEQITGTPAGVIPIIAKEIQFAGGDDGSGNPRPNTSALRDGIQTTDDTANQILNTVTPADGQEIRVISEVMAKRLDAPGEAAWYLLRGVWLRNGGSLVVVKPPTVLDYGASAGAEAWVAQLADNGTAVETQVTGELGKTIHWSIIREYIEAA